MRILFVDDNPVRCWRFLKKQKGAMIADGAKDALGMIVDHGPWDVVLIEYHLEDTEGTTAKVILDALKAMDPAKLPVMKHIILHTLDQEAALMMLTKLGRMGYINTEWIRFDDLEATLPLSA